MVQRVKVEGLKDLERALKELPKATGKNVLRRVGRKRLEPIAEDFRGRVRVDDRQLLESIGVSTRLSKRQRRLKRKEPKSTVEVYVGAGALPQAITEEFGTVNQAPHPGLRPAWDRGGDAVLDGIAADLWAEVRKAAERLARKAARMAKAA